MHRAIPVSNKLLSKKWDENNRRIHAEKLKNMQSRVNSGSPMKFSHLKFKAKREQIVEDRLTEIERENRILLEKMSSIMSKKQNKDNPSTVKSLNKNARKEQMRRITLDNQALLKRLQEKNPCYNTHMWEEERRKTEKRLKNMCEFPYSLGRGESTPVNYKKPRKLSPLSKSVVFKKGVAIGQKYFLVEIHKNKE
jgi:Hemingway/CFA97